MSFPHPAELAAFPDLTRWLQGRQWASEFSPRAKHDATRVKFASIKVRAGGPDDPSELVIEARTTGPWATATTLFLFADPELSAGEFGFDLATECTCDGEFCEHAFAVLNTLSPIALRPPESTSPTRNRRLEVWLREISEAGASVNAGPIVAQPYPKFIAYCIEPPGAHFGYDAGKVFFAVRLGNRKKSGFSIESNLANPDPARPAKYMADEDVPICTRLQIRNRKFGLWTSVVPLEGAEWDEILGPALATGRLFYGQNTRIYGPSSDYRALKEGPPLIIEPSWEMLPDGGAKPILKLPSPDLRVIETQPLRYLDLTHFLLGRLQSSLPPALLRAWPRGPIVSAETIPELSRELSAIWPDNALPLPAEEPAQRLTGVAPTPILHITNVHVGIFQKRHVGGVLKFRYRDSPPLFPLGPDDAPTAAWFSRERRLQVNRDSAAEAKLAQDLTNHGLTPLQELFPEDQLTAKNRHSVVLKEPTPRAADWLEFLESPSCEALKAKGWLIEADPELGLSVHDMRDFFPAIEADPDHGIDWFRFEVSGEFEGKRVSLIPHIARAIAEDWPARYADPAQTPETLLLACEKPEDGHIRFPARRFLEMVEQVRHLFHGAPGDGPLRLDRLSAAGLADALAIDSSETTRALAALGRNLRDIQGLPAAKVPATVKAKLRPYQLEGFRWLQFLAHHGLHGILADDMGLGKTLQTLAYLAAEHAKSPGQPSLVIAPTSVVPNWVSEVQKFVPRLKVLVLHGGGRAENFSQVSHADLVLTSYPLLVRDFEELSRHQWHVLVLDEAQYIKNPKSLSASSVCKLTAAHRLCLSGTPMENHLGELWSLMRFLMPGFLGDEKAFNALLRRPIERDRSRDAQIALNRRVSPLILRRTKDQVATELPTKTTLLHGIDLSHKQADLYESVRAAMDRRVREAIASKGLAKSHIIVLDALLKLRQICCHPRLLKSEAAQRVTESAKLEFLTQELLPTLLEEGRRILLFSQFTSMLALIETHLQEQKIPFLKLIGQTKERASLVGKFQAGEVPIFLISLKAGGTGLNLTAADTVIHYDPWWNPAAENQATDRAHRIGQTKPVFVHKLVCRGTIEERILDLQKRKSALVEALLSEETSQLKIDAETLSHLFSPLG